MVPETPEAMYNTLLGALLTRVYGDIATAARRKRLTEHDIAQIERSALSFLAQADRYAAEFPNFDARQVAARVANDGRQLFESCRAERAQQIAKEH